MLHSKVAMKGLSIGNNRLQRIVDLFPGSPSGPDRSLYGEWTYTHTREQHPLHETHIDAVRGLIELRGFHPSASTSGARRSDAAMSNKDKEICFMLMSRT